MIEAENLSRRYGGMLAVDALNLRVRAGEVVGLLGPNGAGKTTSLRMLAGFLAPSGGRARIGGHDVERQPHAARCA
ncbi:MAG TPA: ATP-binding cassette domain-containing protein, partial [Rhodanobacteraceae bacterium]|nr:ATP-binding cassette domain-containing protein [Rhodanobacteraceae bacterium]